MAYDKNFKLAVVKFYKKCKNKVKVSKLFDISLISVVRWTREYDEKGDIGDPKPRKRSSKKVDRHELKNYVNKHPDALQKEIAKHFRCSRAAIYKAFEQLGITRKKDQMLQRARRKKARRIRRKMGKFGDKKYSVCLRNGDR
jgi:transposase